MKEKRELLYEGKAKEVFATDDPGYVIIHYKDSATAFNNLKKATIENKGVFSNEIASIIFRRLAEAGIPTHYVETLNDREQLCHRVKIIPLEVIVRNVVAGSMAKRLGMEEGTVVDEPIFEICFKDDALGDPLINDWHAIALGAATREELDRIYSLTASINSLLKDLFSKVNVRLIDFKIEFGKTSDGEIVLADEISPDTCRFWDAETGEKLDKDRFRRDLGNVLGGYEEIDSRLNSLNKSPK